MKTQDPKRLRIVFLSFAHWPADFGGELLLSLERLHSLAEQGHSIVALTGRPLGFSRQQQEQTIQVSRCPVAGRGPVARAVYILWAASRLLRMSFDVLHLGLMPACHAPTAALAAWLFASIAKFRRARTVSVVSLADKGTEFWQVRGRTGLFRRLYYQKVDHIVAVSPGLFEPLKRWRPRKAVLITYGVRDDLFRPLSIEERRSTRVEFGIPHHAVIFITIGAVIKRKGYDLLAQAFAGLGCKYDDWYLWLIGPMSRAEGCGTGEVELAEMMAPLQTLTSQVRCFGRIDDRPKLRRLLGASDVFVFPTRREGLGVAPMEAMSMGLPAIVSRIPGVTDVACVDHETGLLVPVGDVGSLARAMEQLGNDPGLRATFGKKAQQRIREKFSWKHHTAQWDELYERGISSCAQ